MHRRTLLATLGAGTAGVLAGCAAPTARTDETVGDVDWLDGETLDTERLSTTHAETLETAGSFELFSTAETEHDGGTEPSRWLPSQEYEAAFESERQRQYLRQEMGGGDEREVFEVYVDGSAAFRRERWGENATTDRWSIDRPDAFFTREFEIEATTGVRGVGGWNMRVVDRAAEIDGHPAVHLDADSFTGDAGIPETVDEATATMLVTGAGVVRLLEQQWEGEHDGQAAIVEVDIAFEGIGETTIEEPEWVTDMRA
ncbi:DUF7537 family lipoprotein [Halorubrum vacuolatum]|uniref:Lipoprotein n=1 Tax=Halorubrum vacuolatum TaxID=63740 RepID=A0A238VQ40_HALVU|nr:hypothetical protein [Halorubrum vacuolatum]SNR35609.1 hypothetical protein SAMN06264855_103148 [Halorubrum vacuolatum]